MNLSVIYRNGEEVLEIGGHLSFFFVFCTNLDKLSKITSVSAMASQLAVFVFVPVDVYGTF